MRTRQLFHASSRFYVALVLAISASVTANAVPVYWADPGTDDWTDGTNWSTASPPGAGDLAYVGLGGTAQLAASTTVSDMRAGHGDTNAGNGTVELNTGADLSLTNAYIKLSAGFDGTVDHNDGTMNVNGGTLHVGYGDGTGEGIYNLGGGTLNFTSGADLEMRYRGTFNWISGTITSVDEVRIGTLGGDYKAVFNLGGNTLTTGGIVQVGQGGGSQADEFNFQGGTLNSGAYFLIGGSTAPGGTAVTLNSGETLTTGTELYVGNVAGSSVFNQNNGLLTIGNNLIIANTAGSDGTFNLDDGNVVFDGTPGNIHIRHEGAFNWNDADLAAVITNLGAVEVGIAAGAYKSVFNLGGHTLDASFVQLGNGGGSEADEFNFQGGTADLSAHFLIGGSTAPGGTVVDLNPGDTLSTGTVLYVGNVGGTSAVFNQNGGSLTIGTDLVIGNVATNQGTFNLNSGTIEFTDGNSDIQIPHGGTFNWIGGSLDRLDSATDDVGLVQVGHIAGSDNAVFNLGGHTLNAVQVLVSNNATSSLDEFNFQGGTVNTSSVFLIGGSTALGGAAVNLNTGDTLTTASHLYVGNINGTSANFRLNGGSLTIGDDLIVSNTATSEGTFRLNSGTVLFTGGTSDINLERESDMVVSGGSLSGANNLFIGRLGAGTATYTQTGGTVTIDDFVRVGDAPGPEDFFNLGGGTFNLPNASADFVMENDSTANISGGTLNIARDMLVGTIASQLATVNQSGGVVNIANDLSLATVAGANADYNLTGGVLNVAGVVDLEAPGTKTFTLDGGTLAATTIDDAVGGGVFDWQSGTLTPGPLGTAATLTYNGSNLMASSGSIFHFDLQSIGLAGGPNDLLVVPGDLTLDGSVTINALAGFEGTGSYPIIQVFGSIIGDESSLGVPNPEIYSIEFVDFGSFTQINLVIVPEPSSLMLGMGALGLAAIARRRRRSAGRRVHAMHQWTDR